MQTIKFLHLSELVRCYFHLIFIFIFTSLLSQSLSLFIDIKKLNKKNNKRKFKNMRINIFYAYLWFICVPKKRLCSNF